MGSTEALTGAGKATMFNEVFLQNFNASIPPMSPTDCQNFYISPSLCPDNLLCSEDDFLKMLLAVDTSVRPLGLTVYPPRCLKLLLTQLLPA